MPIQSRPSRVLAYLKHLGSCPEESSAYGKCVSEKAEKIRLNDCQPEFQRLITCFQKAAKGKK